MVSTKFQVPNNKQISITPIRNPKLSSFGHWSLEFGICLGFEIWDFKGDGSQLTIRQT
jgi:hypothetical protein